jgi:hypothetical protein
VSFQLKLVGQAGTIAGAAKSAGRDIASALWQGFKDVSAAQLRAIDEFEPILRRARAQAIVDPQERERTMVNLDYDEQVRAARREKLPTAALAAARAQELANIDARYAREAAEKQAREEEQAAERRKQVNEDASYDIARLKIETSKQGLDKEMALLKLRQEKEMADARLAGADTGLLAEKHALERKDLELRNQATPEGSTAGTFSGWAAAVMGTGGVQERIAKASELTAKEIQQYRKDFEWLKNSAVPLAMPGAS